MNIYLRAPIDQEALLDKATLHHLRVRRIRNHDILHIVDGQGGRYQGKLRLDKQACIVDIQPLSQDPNDNQLTLIIGIPKLATFELILQQAVELGATHIYPLISEYTPVKHQLLLQKQQSGHWQKILIQAMMQSGRSWLTKLTPIRRLSETEWPACVILHPYADLPLTNTDLDQTPAIAIGPEGGWSEHDLRQLTAKCQLRKLKMPIMRSETATTAALSLMQLTR